MKDLGDAELERAFEAWRRVEQRQAAPPPFRQVVSGRRAPRRSGAPYLGWLLAGAAAALTLSILLPAHARRAELELARRVLAWRAPTDFLLERSSLPLLSTVPELTRALPGSPLAALDPGGELGPPPLSRSPQ